MTEDHRRDRGTEAEKKARQYLQKKGYEVVERNYRTPQGEIDLIVRKRETLVFVEVKGGRLDPDFSPANHLDVRKQKKLLALAQAYLSRERSWPPVRFDLITVEFHGRDCAVAHWEDVIQDRHG